MLGNLIVVMVQEMFSLSVPPTVECFTDNWTLTDFLKISHVIQDTQLRVDVAREMLNLNEIHIN